MNTHEVKGLMCVQCYLGSWTFVFQSVKTVIVDVIDL